MVNTEWLIFRQNETYIIIYIIISETVNREHIHLSVKAYISNVERKQLVSKLNLSNSVFSSANVKLLLHMQAVRLTLRKTLIFEFSWKS